MTTWSRSHVELQVVVSTVHSTHRSESVRCLQNILLGLLPVGKMMIDGIAFYVDPTDGSLSSQTFVGGEN